MLAVNVIEASCTQGPPNERYSPPATANALSAHEHRVQAALMYDHTRVSCLCSPALCCGKSVEHQALGSTPNHGTVVL